ncbi:rhamnogalacturonan acetylesterase [uncultured Formosa sp.]|uniref:rhamnogalacturonan acetylesterase n=1 Tax=uncultured Formosa sp. TaxID=255435 RepID=UPI0026395D95|nr:rhamnogalacturonan acetylesterase [uncultured Formosa sp.]
MAEIKTYRNFKVFVILILCAVFLSLKTSQERKVKIYMIGDSTMANKKQPETNPEFGWGQVFSTYFNPKVTVDNRAVNGRSSRSFIIEGRWDSISKYLQPGDYVFIQFGHNDQKEKDPKRYTNPYTQYRYNLERFVKDTREKGGIPILLSSIVRRNFNEFGTLVDTHGAYPLVTRLVADDLSVPFIDLEWLTEELEMRYGPNNSAKLHLHFKPGENPYYPEGKNDDTHLSFKGALEVSKLVVSQLKKQVPELVIYLK